MSPDLCRLCLSEDNLSDIFVKKEYSTKYSAVLYAATGLNITPEDGLPQQICKNCTDLLNSALKLRKQSHSSATKLIHIGYKLIENNINYEQIDISQIQNFKDISETYEDYENINGLPELEISVECDRLSQSDLEESDNGAKNKTYTQEMSRKEKRQMYLDMVDGVFNPQGPVKCKICKKTVSKWTCFISHAKLHVGFKFICEFCGKSFISSTQLKRHCRSYHGMKRELPCQHCNFLALDKAQLILHERRLHTGERPFVCDSCGASYYSRRCLLQHLESHRATATVQVRHYTA
ncbi:hypothetical protein O3G_MSEX013495 [Manduca sexta]|uniref:Uncharacterized protein n=1 Tax=Manduca sexta TaxID=7130 RepID=A0A921ZSW4_MANSE|nr:hypothetical protein O3G_MSEX013495 [Manduca sexta]